MRNNDKINELVIQLENLGYFSYQVQQMIREIAGTTKLETISQKDKQEIIENLEGYIQFAMKCHNTKLS
ncbi:hypothetical protein [Sporomusa sp. KB1]|uniref:hypothetical protein n=1 Tax=Sporomusa sp. KB1 TaxID=943346 RepID=UPI0011A10211|nr:hypothetical protein [Sporomusa sp. KB1]